MAEDFSRIVAIVASLKFYSERHYVRQRTANLLLLFFKRLRAMAVDFGDPLILHFKLAMSSAA